MQAQSIDILSTEQISPWNQSPVINVSKTSPQIAQQQDSPHLLPPHHLPPLRLLVNPNTWGEATFILYMLNKMSNEFNHSIGRWFRLFDW